MDSFPVALKSLLAPGAYPHPVLAVQLVETHVSWILLTGEFAYKIKRPVHYPFIDTRRLERRKFLCQEELRLNRRFAPELYLAVCAITESAGEACMEGQGEILEFAVRMRQFDRDCELDRLLQSKRVDPDELELFGRDLADIHAELPAAGTAEPWGEPAQIRLLIMNNLSEYRSSSVAPDGEAELQRLQSALERRLREAEPWLAARRANARVRECHGDLHSRNIVRLGARLRPFDCMEFEPAFRWIDVADEIALLLADLDACGYPEHAQAFLNGYLWQSGDYQACRLLNLYKAHRALVRAKVAALRSPQSTASDPRNPLRAEELRLRDCAARALGVHAPLLLLMCGVSGSGKSWLAKRLAPPLRAVLLRSDVERKRRAGLDRHARSGSELLQGMYSAQISEDLYVYLSGCAREVLAAGFSVIVDASFVRRADRGRFRSLAAQLGIDVRIIRCDAPRALLQERVLARQRSGKDESEADARVLDWQLAHFEPLLAEEDAMVINVDTATPNAPHEVLEQCSAFIHRESHVPP